LRKTETSPSSAETPLWEMLPSCPFPGAPSFSERLDEALRVDLAGERGAEAIYEGQLRALGNHPFVPLLEEMATQERVHIKAFEERAALHHVRPSFLTPFWEKAGFLLGLGTGLLGGKAAMACTAAVEEVIDAHYQEQIETLAFVDPELGEFLEKCRSDEVMHRETSLEHGADEAPFSPLLQKAIRTATRLAISIAKKV
jgi:ubiquinone biosynthesis monooxygenase Coq7